MLPWYKKRKKKKTDDLFAKASVKKPVDLTKKLDKVFSAYIRVRDTMPNGCFRCISCGQIKPFSQGDCGHYYSRVHMATRWEPDNCHMECKGCNRVSADHLIGYRKNLVSKIGIDGLTRLEYMAHSSKHWLDFELQEKIDYYTKEVKRICHDKGLQVPKF